MSTTTFLPKYSPTPSMAGCGPRFRETPAAWALLLSTAPIRSQAARLTVGSVQQFVRPDALRSLRALTSPREVRDRWQRAVERHHALRRPIDRRWAVLASELTAVFDAVHKPSSSPRSLAKEVRQKRRRGMPRNLTTLKQKPLSLDEAHERARLSGSPWSRDQIELFLLCAPGVERDQKRQLPRESGRRRRQSSGRHCSRRCDPSPASRSPWRRCAPAFPIGSVTTDQQIIAVFRRTTGLEVFGPNLIRIAK